MILDSEWSEKRYWVENLVEPLTTKRVFGRKLDVRSWCILVVIF